MNLIIRRFDPQPSVYSTISNTNDIEENYNNLLSYFNERISKFHEKGSGLKINNIVMLSVNIGTLRVFKVGSYIDLPPWLKNKKCMINPKNDDQECFKYVFIAGMHYKDIRSHTEQINNLIPFENNYDFSMLSYPVSIDQIPEFELKNQVAIRVSKNKDSIILYYAQ